MNTPLLPMPVVRYYARFGRCEGYKTPKYTATEQSGFYPPMLELAGRDGFISLFLLVSAETGSSVAAPTMRLMGSHSFNFTGLRGFMSSGRLTGYAYGEPCRGETYGRMKPRPNPFRRYSDDCFLFIMHGDSGGTPTGFELIVLAGARALAAAYCKQLASGELSGLVSELRASAVRVE